MNLKSGWLIKGIVGGLVILTIGALWQGEYFSFAALSPAAIRDFLKGFGNWAVVVYIILYILNTITILPPIAPLSLAAGLVFGYFWGAIYLLTAAMVGTSATFFIARFFGRPFVEKILKTRSKDFDEKLGKNGFSSILFLRVVPLVPYEVLNYAGGLSKIKFRDYFWATFLGFIPGVGIAVFFGGSLGEVHKVQDLLAPKFLVAGMMMISILAVPAIFKIIKKN